MTSLQRLKWWLLKYAATVKEESRNTQSKTKLRNKCSPSKNGANIEIVHSERNNFICVLSYHIKEVITSEILRFVMEESVLCMYVCVFFNVRWNSVREVKNPLL